MSGKVTVRTQKFRMCLLGRLHWIAGRRRTSVEKEKRFLEGQSSPQSNAFLFASGTPKLWLALMRPRVSMATGKKVASPAERAQSCICSFILFYCYSTVLWWNKDDTKIRPTGGPGGPCFGKLLSVRWLGISAGDPCTTNKQHITITGQWQYISIILE